MAKSDETPEWVRERRARMAWHEPPVHPAAEMFPMMSDAELNELAADIKANGMEYPIVYWRDNRAAAEGSEGPFPLYLLDGRSRREALRRLGINDPRDARGGHELVKPGIRILDAIKRSAATMTLGGKVTPSEGWETATNPTTFVISLNARRRHLSTEQKRASIKALIEAEPTWSDRKVARVAGASHPTVAAVRSDQDGKTFHSDQLPLERAKSAIRANPTGSQRELAAAAKVAQGTISKARMEMGLNSPRPRGGQRKPTTDPAPVTDPEPVNQAAADVLDRASEALSALDLDAIRNAAGRLDPNNDSRLRLAEVIHRIHEMAEEVL